MTTLMGFARLALFLVTAAASLLFLAQPVAVEAQLAMALAAILVMGAAWRWGRGRYSRWLFLCAGSLVVLRYIVWRATSTLPPLDQPFNLALGSVLVLAELYCVLILVISLIINADPLERPALPREEDAALPTVDVFIPSYNEDEYILATTMAAANALDYPAAKLTVWLLDDGGTDQKIGHADPAKAAEAMERRRSLTELCQQMGVRYLTRARNEHAKAGNMNNGLKHARGDIVVVFDADHAPFRSFLRETVGHFAQDPRLFLVQTPHVFLNPDPIERNLRIFEAMPSENEMFYSVTQRGLDKWDGSFFCGSAALLRRAALDEVGGFSGVTITEDCETAFELHAKGWHSAYVDKPLIAGLQPETFESFIGQRSRWCQGMFQILLLKNPLFKEGLKPIQKLAYLSSMTFWFFPLPRMVFTFAPLLHIFLDVKIFVSSMDEAIAYTATYMVVNLMLQNYLYGRVRWPFISELYEYVQGVYLAKAIVSVIASPRKPSFNVTAKGISLDEDHLSGFSKPFFAIFILLGMGAATAFYRYLFEPGAELMLIAGLWTCFNMVIAGVALGVVAERRQPDRHPRLTIDRRGSLALGETVLPVALTSVSAGGCALRFDEGAAALDPAALETATLTIVPMTGAAASAPLSIELVHATPDRDGVTFGFSFAPMAAPAYAALAELMYGDPGAILRFQTRRRAHKNLFAGSARFLLWGVLEPLRAFSYLGRKRAAPRVAAQVAKAPAPKLEPALSAARLIAAAAEAQPAALRLVAERSDPPMFAAPRAVEPAAATIAAADPAALLVPTVLAAAAAPVAPVEPVAAAVPDVVPPPVPAPDPAPVPSLVPMPAAHVAATVAAHLAALQAAAAPTAAALDEDFEALSDALAPAAPVVPAAPAAGPVAADWMQAMLRLAAAEKKRSDGEADDAAQSIAA